MAETTMGTACGTFELHRGETPLSSPLRAWTAADVLVVDELASTDPGRLLIVNDSWGGLVVPLRKREPEVWSDSTLARRSIADNLERNGLPSICPDRITTGCLIPEGVFDTIVIAVPKSRTLLRHQSFALAQTHTSSTRVLAAGMSRHVTPAMYKSLRGLGEVVPRRAVGKARLVDVFPGDSLESMGRVSGECVVEAFRTGEGVVVYEAPGVFSAGHLDVGTALLLDELAVVQIADLCAAERPLCVDLGCGNGVLGTTQALRWPTTTWELCDVSDLAVKAAEATWLAAGLGERGAVRSADGLEFMTDRSVDIVVTNPPFHQDHAADSDLTARLLRDVARVLRADGAAVVVAQRHLRAHHTLAQFFDQVDTVSKHPSHVVMIARRPRC